MPSSFREEVLKAIDVLDSYCQQKDSLWLYDLLMTANDRMIQAVYSPSELNVSSEKDPGLQATIEYVKILYLEEAYESVLQAVDNRDVTTLSSSELFWASDAAYHLVYDHQGRHVPNDAMDRYQHELQRRFESNQLDPFGAYCLGKIWKRANNTQAVSAFLHSISNFPYFWSCWLELSGVILDTQSFDETINTIPGRCLLKFFFQLHTTNRLLTSSVALSLYQTLHSLFPDSFYLRLQYCVYLYNHEEFAKAFELLSSTDLAGPHTPSDTDLFFILSCNTLYALRDADRLLLLIDQLTALDPVSSVLTLLQGSYWSLLGDHEKAILDFTSAASRTNSYDAWLQLGHEYADLSCPKEAVAAYQKASRENPYDYRAFFAMAQMYAQGVNADMAYYYFVKAIALQSRKTTLWLALGNFHSQQHEERKAVAAWRRGCECDRELGTRDGRRCALQCCSLDTATVEECERWVWSVVETRDRTVALPEGMEVVRRVLEETKDYAKGMELCDRLCNVFGDMVALTEMAGERRSQLRQLLESSKRLACFLETEEI
ncbi:hypothetical protein WA538_005522 [Blastocystis sp. DL]